MITSVFLLLLLSRLSCGQPVPDFKMHLTPEFLASSNRAVDTILHEIAVVAQLASDKSTDFLESVDKDHKIQDLAVVVQASVKRMAEAVIQIEKDAVKVLEHLGDDASIKAKYILEKERDAGKYVSSALQSLKSHLSDMGEHIAMVENHGTATLTDFAKTETRLFENHAERYLPQPKVDVESLFGKGAELKRRRQHLTNPELIMDEETIHEEL